MIRVKCPGCRKTIKAPEKYAGKRAKCPGCSSPIRLPETVEQVVKPAEPRPDAETTVSLRDSITTTNVSHADEATLWTRYASVIGAVLGALIPLAMWLWPPSVDAAPQA